MANCPIAAEALAKIGRLHAIKEMALGKPATQRHSLRQEQARPQLDALKL